jgi:uncharacterized membrane protein
MITTITTTTTTTLSTIGVASLALAAIVTLLVLLVKKELLQASRHEGALRLSRVLNVAIVPLLIVFVITVVMKVIAALQ